TEVTRILSAIEQGDSHAVEQLLPLVYDELRKLAAQRLAQEKPGQTLQATALVHEAYIRLVASGNSPQPAAQARARLPGASGPVSPGPAFAPRACAARRRPTATAARRR